MPPVTSWSSSARRSRRQGEEAEKSSTGSGQFTSGQVAQEDLPLEVVSLHFCNVGGRLLLTPLFVNQKIGTWFNTGPQEAQEGVMFILLYP